MRIFRSFQSLRGYRGEAPGRTSKGDGLIQDPVPNPLPEAPFAHHVDPSAEETLQLSGRGRAFEEGESRHRLHQKVEVALLVGLAAGDGAEYPDVSNPVFLGYGEDLLPAGLQGLLNLHRRRPMYLIIFILPEARPPSNSPKWDKNICTSRSQCRGYGKIHEGSF